jgi:hypothetical protein
MMVPLEGPVGVGALVDAIMLGCLIVQSCVYFKNSRGNTWLLKVLVSLILFLLLSHLGCTAAWLWASNEVNTGDASMPHYAPILFGISSIFGAIISFLERCFFSHRILRASNNHLLAFVFFLFCIFSFTAALGAACTFFANSTSDLMSQLGSGWIFPLVFISGLVCDLAINIATGFYLRYQTPTDITDDLGPVTRLLLLVAETGAVTSLFGVPSVIIYWLTKTNFIWVGMLVFMPGVFANTLLAALNARGHLHADIEHQRARVFRIGDQLIDQRAKRPPIIIAISKQTEKQSEKSPV